MMSRGLRTTSYIVQYMLCEKPETLHVTVHIQDLSSHVDFNEAFHEEELSQIINNSQRANVCDGTLDGQTLA